MEAINKLDQDYWDSRYQLGETGWDLGQISPPLKAYIDQIEDKNLRILIPGCGNTYEAEYLLRQGFTNITVIDIAPALVQNLKNKFKAYPEINIVLGDFFQHEGQYNLILEQTFFCALNPSLRKAYVNKMSNLLAPEGKLAGLLFNRKFDFEGPPFGGHKEEYLNLFKPEFEIQLLDIAHNSHIKRAGNELFMILKKNES